MRRATSVLVIVLLSTIGLLGCGGGSGGGNAQAQVPSPGGGAFTIPAAPRVIRGVNSFSVNGFGIVDCYVDGDIEVVNNILKFTITGPDPECIGIIGVEIIVPTTSMTIAFHSR